MHTVLRDHHSNWGEKYNNWNLKLSEWVWQQISHKKRELVKWKWRQKNSESSAERKKMVGNIRKSLRGADEKLEGLKYI